ncbi:MAG TPA: META domain-containing protein [Saprospiraceae bacterium]|nr:META domain-containing protein [Saprospiraceae bacterium]
MKFNSKLLVFVCCLLGHGVITGQAPTEFMAGKQMEKSPESTIYFKASSIDPVWSVTLSPHLIAFKSQVPGFGVFNSPHAEPVKAMDSNVKKYTLQTEEGTMEIELYKMLCMNEKTGEQFPYSVKVSIQHTTDSVATSFNGCGKYVTDPGLEATWVLYAIGADTVTASQFNDTLPHLDLYARGNSFEGNSGCNTIRGRIFSERSLLRFTDLILTKRKCANIAREEQFTQALQFSTQYLLEDEKLILSNHAGVTLVFKNAGRKE